MDEISSSFEISLAKFVGRVEEKIDHFASTFGLLPQDVTVWFCAGLLGLPSSLRSPLGESNRVSDMRIQTTASHQGLRSEMEERIRASNSRPRKMAREKRDAIKSGRKGGKSAWSNMTKAERSAEMKRRQAVARKNREKATNV